MNKIDITLNSHIDREVIDSQITDAGHFFVTVKNAYYPESIIETAINAGDLSPEMLEAFKKVCDWVTYSIEEMDYYWKITQTLKGFTLEGSYWREIESTETVNPIPDGSPLIMRVEIPNFDSNIVVSIDLWYNMDFNPVDIAALAAIGIDLTGNGYEFTIDNSAPCKISFLRPDTALVGYVIDYNMSAQITPV